MFVIDQSELFPLVKSVLCNRELSFPKNTDKLSFLMEQYTVIDLIEDNICFVWPEHWSCRLRARVQSEGQTKQLLSKFSRLLFLLLSIKLITGCDQPIEIMPRSYGQQTKLYLYKFNLWKDTAIKHQNF